MRGMHVLRILSCIVDRYTQASPWVIVDNRASLSPSHLPPSPSPRHSLTDWPFASCSTWTDKFQLPRFFLEEVRDRGWRRMSNLLLQLDTPPSPTFPNSIQPPISVKVWAETSPTSTHKREIHVSDNETTRAEPRGRKRTTNTLYQDEVGFETSTFKAF